MCCPRWGVNPAPAMGSGLAPVMVLIFRDEVPGVDIEQTIDANMNASQDGRGLVVLVPLPPRP